MDGRQHLLLRVHGKVPSRKFLDLHVGIIPTGGYGKRNAKLVVAFEFICRFLRVARSRL